VNVVVTETDESFGMLAVNPPAISAGLASVVATVVVNGFVTKHNESSAHALRCWCCIVIRGRLARHGVLSVFPFLAADRTRILAGGLTQPFAHALEMKWVATFPPHHGAIFTGIFDAGTHSFESGLADPTHIIVGVPTPRRHRVEARQSHFQTNRGDSGGAAGLLVFVAGNHHRLTRSFLAAGHTGMDPHGCATAAPMRYLLSYDDTGITKIQSSQVRPDRPSIRQQQSAQQQNTRPWSVDCTFHPPHSSCSRSRWRTVCFDRRLRTCTYRYNNAASCPPLLARRAEE
jgi:hypothetical protein